MTEIAIETNNNILDLARFRLKKQESYATQTLHTAHPSLVEVSSQEIGSQIDNIKKSIQRINKLMAELRSISDKPNVS